MLTDEDLKAMRGRCDYLSESDDLPRCLAEIARLRLAIKNCIDWANGRETEWGGRAETAFRFLEEGLNDHRSDQGRPICKHFPQGVPMGQLCAECRDDGFVHVP